MITRIMQIDESSLSEASKIINDGGLVAFPTETVYGLGVSALNGSAVKKVFEAKGRPSDNPLIVHLSAVEDLYKVTDSETEIAKKLLSAFAPGPITVVLHKKPEIADEVTAGLDTVGIRIPGKESARKFIAACNVPIAAPSANSSQRPSPTTAQAVMEDMKGKIPLILDGGSCEVGIESTVVDCRGRVPIVLRMGKITGEDIKEVCGEVEYANANSAVRSPGMKYRHYAPCCEMLVRFGGYENLREIAEKYVAEGRKLVILGSSRDKGICGKAYFINLGDTLNEFMENYFSALREGEKNGDLIICHIPFEEEVAEGLYNRAKKSCGGKLI